MNHLKLNTMRKKKKYQQTKHHRLPKCLGGTDDPSNISFVRDDRHRAYHLLFSEGSPDKVVMRLNKYWIDPAYELVVVPKEYGEGIRKRISSYLKTKDDGN